MAERKMKLKLNPSEKRLIDLNRIATQTDQISIRRTCISLILWFQRTGQWTEPQQMLISRLKTGHERSAVLWQGKETPAQRKRRRKPYVLYAVRIGTELKVGITCSIEQRMKSFQTSSSEVELLHQIVVGYNRGHAVAQERKAHKFLKARGYWTARELFRMEALEVFRNYKPKIKEKFLSYDTTFPSKKGRKNNLTHLRDIQTERRT